ncbi:MAG: helix-turn-helix domain-containing protein [Ramlibacter sp.]
MKPHLDRPDLELLLAIRERGSLAAAAAAADVVPSVITKRLAALEARLGLKLFQRTTRRVVPTPRASNCASGRPPCSTTSARSRPTCRSATRNRWAASAWRPRSGSAAPGSGRRWRSSGRGIRGSRCSCS